MKTWLNIAVVLVIGASIICFVCFSFIQYFFPHPNPRSTFKYLVMKPIPNSVTNVQEGDRIALDSVFRVLLFQISQTDLQKILDCQHFTPIDEGEEFKYWDTHINGYVRMQREEYFKYWERRILNVAKLDVSLTKDWQVYTLKERNGQKHLFLTRTARKRCLWRKLIKKCPHSFASR